MNSGGFTFIGISFLMLPLFLACMVVVSSYQLISKYTEVQKTCRTHVLKAQKVLGKKLMDLMDLNPQAKSLRTQEATLRKSIAAALVTYPPAAVPFQKLLEINLMRQGILRGRQERILWSAVSEARKIMNSLAQDFPRETQFHYSRVSLNVYKSPASAIAPDHLPVPLFRDLQTIEVKWKTPLTYFVPKFLLQLFPNVPRDVSERCSATLIQRGDVWNPKLHQARF